MLVQQEQSPFALSASSVMPVLVTAPTRSRSASKSFVKIATHLTSRVSSLTVHSSDLIKFADVVVGIH